MLGSLGRYLGPRALQPTHYSERDWNRDEWTRGAYSATFGVGGLSRFGEDLRRPIGPIAFAGTDIAGEGTMHMDGAVRSGHGPRTALLGTWARARSARSAAARPRRPSPPPSCARAPAGARSASRG